MTFSDVSRKSGSHGPWCYDLDNMLFIDIFIMSKKYHKGDTTYEDQCTQSSQGQS